MQLIPFILRYHLTAPVAVKPGLEQVTAAVIQVAQRPAIREVLCRPVARRVVVKPVTAAVVMFGGQLPQFVILKTQFCGTVFCDRISAKDQRYKIFP